MVETGESSHIKKFGTFAGVFVPTVLTILGVIMFLRLGWVVGNVGLLGSWIIILLAFGITTTTALSMSSIVTNMRIGSGGAYSIIARSLGLEVGGSIGLPLYLSLSLSMVMYIFGFREGLRLLLPSYSPLLIDLVVFAVLFLLVFLSTSFAFKIQYIILAIVIGAIISVFATGMKFDASFTVKQASSVSSFWIVFAVFFPAATGIMAGANMSGELKNPKKSIPIGTISAILVSLIIYLVLAYYLASTSTASELISNFTILVDKAIIGELVLAGLLAATFSSALNSLVGASRILQAMGEHNILPGSGWFSKRTTSGEPRNAILVTGLIVVAGIMLRDLNTVAPLITMFFLITYVMINIVILIEQSLELVSFRPLLKIPKFVPFIGAAGCLFAMFIINPLFSLAAIIVVGIFYYVLMFRHLQDSTPYGDVRSSLFVSLAEWAAKKSKNLPHSQERAWVPHLLVPMEKTAEVRGVSELIRDITYPRGSVSILGVNIEKRNKKIEDDLDNITNNLKEDGIYTDWSIVEGNGFAEDTISSMQTLKRTLFSPNITFLRTPKQKWKEEEVKEVIKKATENLMGVCLYAGHPQAGLGQRNEINLWLSKQCQDWKPGEKLPNCDLAVLIAYKLKINWEAKLNLIVPVGDKEKIEEVEDRVKELIEVSRIPVNELIVVKEDEAEYQEKAPQADINVFSLPPKPDLKAIKNTVQVVNSSCLFCRDSTEESILA